jgi:hypothetical protein
MQTGGEDLDDDLVATAGDGLRVLRMRRWRRARSS